MIAQVFDRVVDLWLRFPQLQSGLRLTATFFALFAVIYALERYSGVSTRHYRTWTFVHDTAFWLIYHVGIYRLTATYLIITFIAPHLAIFRIGLLDAMPAIPRFFAYFIIADFLQYWVHRLQHSVKFLWFFHAAHHAAKNLTFPASHRNHPIEQFIGDVIFLIPVLALGADPPTGILIAFLLQFQGAIRHSELPWRYGPFYRCFVSPTFHAFHHSMQARHIDKNFALNLSIWDFLFGTAVDEPERPTEYGLKDIQMPTLGGVLFQPFRLLALYYLPRPKTKNPA